MPKNKRGKKPADKTPVRSKTSRKKPIKKTRPTRVPSPKNPRYAESTATNDALALLMSDGGSGSGSSSGSSGDKYSYLYRVYDVNSSCQLYAVNSLVILQFDKNYAAPTTTTIGEHVEGCAGTGVILIGRIVDP